MRRWVTVKEACVATSLSLRTVRDHSQRCPQAFIRPLEVRRVLVDLDAYTAWLQGKHEVPR